MKADIRYTEADFSITDLAEKPWKAAKPITVKTYWNGETAPKGRGFTVRLMWSDSGLYALFDAGRSEELVVAENPDNSKKTMNLWDRDVVELFLAPDRKQPKVYFEFEAAPTGEWLDVALDSTSGNRVSDWNYTSRMEAAAKIERERVLIAMKIPWGAFGKRPSAGDVWLGNLLRCVGKGPGRGYLAWSPTLTDLPNFHVPDRFGEFLFVK
jgi:alpha-galactosidase